MAKFTFTCRQCRQKLAVPEEAIGTTGKCFRCGASVIVPTPEQEATYLQALREYEERQEQEAVARENEASPQGAQQAAKGSRLLLPLGIGTAIVVVCGLIAALILVYANTRAAISALDKRVSKCETSIGVATKPQTVSSGAPSNPGSNVINNSGVSVEHWKWDYREDGRPFIVGAVVNNSQRSYSGVTVTFNLYDASDAQLGVADAYLANLEANGRWNFQAFVLYHNATKAKLVGITGSPDAGP